MKDLSNTKILIAEDERIVALDLQLRLENAGYQVVASVIKGEDAVQKAFDTLPDLAIMDIHLKGTLDGISAADEIHMKLDIPVVYLTSYDNKSTLERAKHSKAYAYLIKPFEERTLLSTIEVALYKHSLDREVKQREEHFRRLIENITDLIVVIDNNKTITYASPSVETILSYPTEKFVGNNFFDFCHPSDLPDLTNVCEAAMHPPGQIWTIEHHLLMSNGSYLTVLTTGKYVIEKENSFTILNSHNITEAKAASEALRVNEERFRGIVERNFDAIISLDMDGNVTYVSPSAERISGYQADEIVGKSFFSFLVASDLGKFTNVFSKSLKGEIVEGAVNTLVRKDGQLIYIESNIIPVLKDGNVVGIQGIFRDITERKQSELELQHIATHDYLTNLPNSRFFLEHLEKAIARARRSQLYVALLYLDLDGFKNVNDTFGHTTGDYLLKMVARRLEDRIRKADIVSRLGGDEFAILMADIHSLNNVDNLAKRLHRAMQAPFQFGNVCTNITISIGISTFPCDTKDAHALIQLADRAMYNSKTMGKNRFSYFSNLINR